MKRTLLAAVAATLFGSAMAMAADPYITNTRHNFNADGYSWADGQICKPCHTPHHAMDPSVSTRLWNHKLSTATYTLYEGEDRTAAEGQGMDRISRLCLGCHDGTIALDAFGIDPTSGAPFGGTGANMGTNAGAWAAGGQGLRNNLGTDFRDDHPVGEAAPYGGGYLKPMTPGSNGSGSVMSAGGQKLSLYALPGAAAGAAPVVSCYTCHNPHGAGVTAGTPFTYLLRTSPDNLCLTCHTK